VDEFEKVATPSTPRGAARVSVRLSNGVTLHVATWETARGGYTAMAINTADNRRFYGDNQDDAVAALTTYFEKA
jgi:hypothetical protein